MSDGETIVVRPSLVRMIITVVVSGGLFLGGLLFAFGPGIVLTIAAIVVAAFAVLTLITSVVRGTPSVTITPTGFTARALFGGKEYRWADIDGDFEVHSRGLMKLVVFRLTPEYQHRANKMPMAPCPGFHDAIAGNFEKTIPELAELLNQQRRKFAPAAT